ncbi:uncharacterized protein ACA1_059160 [Acanthamoeba castellanii str. Neff]|uniref:Uncharacterized protein n=1 Tax=Acanthamoeba castellanii (strain ATCC 30010 / Neff) TaxID=1257118 RepID=L8GVH6_ACACF|nr:uncharacterized protein ACA1_059160 [Acanthamoeba castellanii str. Neff]ELR17229.1 hypothetical protein ACA1_059160 [Acanthamoeba castellanii str. Neff]
MSSAMKVWTGQVRLVLKATPVRDGLRMVLVPHHFPLEYQMDAFQAAEAAAIEANYCLLKELAQIWKCICLSEYIMPDGCTIDVQKPAMITCKVMDCFNNHPFHSKLVDDQAK